eukprot:1903136-Amphidinium_carterae.1
MLCDLPSGHCDTLILPLSNLWIPSANVNGSLVSIFETSGPDQERTKASELSERVETKVITSNFP